MKNILLQIVRKINLLSSQETKESLAEGDLVDRVCYDEFGGKVYLLTKQRAYFEVTIDRKTLAVTNIVKRDLSDSILPEQETVNMILHKFNNAIIFVLRDGTISQMSLSSHEIEIIGEQDTGFLAAELSPCEEMLVLATGGNSLLLFDKEFSLLDEKPLDDGEGTGPMVPTHCKISWRFDSNYFSVLFGDKEGNKCLTKDRYLATFKSISKADPDGGLIKSVAEKRYPELGRHVFWIPNGSLIFSSDVVPSGKNKGAPRVIMWEKNCLRHGEFELPKSVSSVEGLAWNTASKILAVHVVEANSNHSILFYIRNNYKWFLKNRVSLSSENLPVLMVWSSKQKTHLFLLTQQGELERLALREKFGIGCVREEPDRLANQSLSLVIDGNSVGVTPMCRYSMAPPLSHFSIKYPADQDWTVVETTSCEGLICSLLRGSAGQQRLYVSKYEFDQKLSDSHLLTNFEDQVLGQHRTRMLQALRTSPPSSTTAASYVVSFVNGNETSGFSLGAIKFNLINKSEPGSVLEVKVTESTTKEVKAVTFGFTFSTLKSDSTDRICYIQEDGSWIDQENELISDSEINTSIPAEILSRLAFVLPYGHSLSPSKPALGLESSETVPLQCLFVTEGGQLFNSQGLITDNCTSCVVSPTGFVLTTVMTQGMFDLMFVHKLSEVGTLRSAIQRAPKTSSGKDYRLRNVERGSEIVCVAGQRVILDLPRGNLEVIYPKYLLFHYIKHLIVEEKKYFEAYKEIRRHKLDLNLLIDVSPVLFSQVVHNGTFLKQFRKVDDINLILTSLEAHQAPDLQYITDPKPIGAALFESQSLASAPASSEDESGTGRGPSSSTQLTHNKINSICELLRAEMVKSEPDHFVLSIVMTYCRQVPPRLEEALGLVREIQQREEQLAAQEMLGESQEDASISGLAFSIPAPPHLNPTTGKRDKKAVAGVGRPKHSSQEVLEYLSWVSDPEFLYSVALATFDLQLAVMVAETTQRDPKEYLPYIETLKKIDNEVDRKVKICLDTKRWDKAVEMLALGNESQVQKALALIKEKNLFAHGLDAFSQTADFVNLDKVKELLAKYYQKHADHKHAGPLFNSIGHTADAIESFNQALDWKSGLAVIEAQSGHKQTELDSVLQVADGLPNREDFLQKLQEDYMGRKLYPEAAKILRRRANFDMREYLTLLIEKAGDCRTLKQIKLSPITNTEHKELVQKVVVPALELRAEITISDLGKKIEEHTKLKARLAVVQDKKLAESEGGLAGLLLGMGSAQKFDNVSELSLESKGTAGISVVTGASTASKKMKQPKNLAKRKVQEGSPFEEEYLVEKLNLFKVEENEVKEAGHLVDALILYGRASKAREVIEALVKAEEAASKKKGFAKTLRQTAFEKEHPELAEIYNHIEEFQDPNHLKQLEEKELKKGKKSGSAQELKDKFGWLFENPN